MSYNPPTQPLDRDLALLRLRRDAGDRWLCRRTPAPGRDARHLAALAQATRHLAALQSLLGDDGSTAIPALLAEAARRVREHAAAHASEEL